MVNIIFPLLLASLAAVGNALFALGQKQSAGAENGLLYVGCSALVATLLSLAWAPAVGKVDFAAILRFHWRGVILSGVGLFLTYVGFNLLYARFGVSQYVLYAVISIITTTLIVGIWWLREPVNVYHGAAILLSVVAVILFSLGQSRG